MIQVKRTSNAKDCTFREFSRDSILDLAIGLIIHGCCSEGELLSSDKRTQNNTCSFIKDKNFRLMD